MIRYRLLPKGRPTEDRALYNVFSKTGVAMRYMTPLVVNFLLERCN